MERGMIIVFFWIVFSAAVGLFASVRRNRNGFGWFVLSLLVSPIIAIIFCAILESKPKKIEPVVEYREKTAEEKQEDFNFAGKIVAAALGAPIVIFVIAVIIGMVYR
jgi:hypothetical protein